MNMLITAVGVITLLACSIALLAYAYNVFSEWQEHREQQRFYRAKEKAAKQIGQSLLNESYWFSESKETFTALNMIGIEMAHTGSFNVSDIRDAWRKSVAGEKAVAAE